MEGEGSLPHSPVGVIVDVSVTVTTVVTVTSVVVTGGSLSKLVSRSS